MTSKELRLSQILKFKFIPFMLSYYYFLFLKNKNKNSKNDLINSDYLFIFEPSMPLME